MKEQIIGSVPGNVLGMFADLAHKLQHGSITPEELERFLKKQNPFIGVSELMHEWKQFYCDVFGLEKDFSGIRIPEKQKGFDRLLIIAKGMTPMKLYNKIAELMPARKYFDDLDKIVSDRKADHDYAIWIRDRVEADEELKNKSAADLKQEDIPGVTIEERFIYELKFFKETGNSEHLDVKNITLCSGSRLPYAHVPFVHWRDVGVSVDWDYPVHQHAHLRSRAVIF